MMRKSLLVLFSALAVSHASFARAANAEPFSQSPPRFSQQDLAAFAESRIAALKAGLQLTPAQEKNWPALEAALRDVAKAHAERFQALRQDGLEKPGAADPLASLQRHAQAIAARAADLEKIVAAARPLYETLDDAQKRRFGALIRVAVHGRFGHGAGPFQRPHDGHPDPRPL